MPFADVPHQCEQQSPWVGSWAKLHGHGNLQLHTSNQSPRRRQSTFADEVVIDSLPSSNTLGGVSDERTVTLLCATHKYPPWGGMKPLWVQALARAAHFTQTGARRADRANGAARSYAGRRPPRGDPI